MAKPNIETSRQLYKHLLRACQRLPKESRSHYQHHVRQGFVSHADESDPERVRQIIDRALLDAEWVLNKYVTVEGKT